MWTLAAFAIQPTAWKALERNRKALIRSCIIVVLIYSSSFSSLPFSLHGHSILRRADEPFSKEAMSSHCLVHRTTARMNLQAESRFTPPPSACFMTKSTNRTSESLKFEMLENCLSKNPLASRFRQFSSEFQLELRSRHE